MSYFCCGCVCETTALCSVSVTTTLCSVSVTTAVCSVSVTTALCSMSVTTALCSVKPCTSSVMSAPFVSERTTCNLCVVVIWLPSVGQSAAGIPNTHRHFAAPRSDFFRQTAASIDTSCSHLHSAVRSSPISISSTG